MPKNKETEAQIQKRIKSNLSLYCPEVVHIDRLNSGSIHQGSLHMQLCVKGTPDLYAILKTGQLLFIEVKRKGGRQSDDQKRFQHMLDGIPNIHYLLAFSIGDVIDYINENIKNEHTKS